MAEETIQRVINTHSSSIEIGTPSKGGVIKVYFDPENLDEAKQRIDNAIEARRYAQTKVTE